MSLEDVKTVDAIGIQEETGNVILTVSDYLEWKDNDNNHLFLLQEKFNAYISFVESGEIFEVYPNAKGKKILIEVVYKFPLSKQAQYFYKQVNPVLERAGLTLQHRLLEFAPRQHKLDDLR